MMNMTAFLHQLLINDKEVLAEGAQGTLLDVYNGTYPFVTSSFTSVAGVLGYCGIPPQKIGRIFGVFKAYTTRVGNGPFPTELLGDEGNLLREMGREFGATTGRPRRCGWLDLPELAYACRANGVTHLVMTKADILGELPEFKVNTGYHVDELYGSMEFGYTPEIDHLIRAPYNDLTFQGFKSVDDPAFRHFVKTVEGHLYRQINYVSFGPERDALIELAH
jgi:adenylosuccinate synthase